MQLARSPAASYKASSSPAVGKTSQVAPCRVVKAAAGASEPGPSDAAPAQSAIERMLRLPPRKPIAAKKIVAPPPKTPMSSKEQSAIERMLGGKKKSQAQVQESGMSRRGLLAGAATAAMLACPCCQEIAAQASEWGYGDVSGPVAWQGVCSTGRRQSPVDITAPGEESFEAPFGDPAFDYGSSEVTVLNTGHGTMQVNFQPGNMAMVPITKYPTKYGSADGLELQLLQYHFHTPSEHAINGKRFAMEVHLVHRNIYSGGLAVFGVMLQSGGDAPHPGLQLGLDYGPKEHGKEVPAPKPFDPSVFLPPAVKGKRPYVHYPGSLTTPPCSEGVDWFVMTTPQAVTDKQVIQFMEYAGDGLTYPRTARPLQPLNQRNLEYFL